MKINVNKKYQTRSGRPVRILCIDAKGDYPIVGLVLDEDGEEVAKTWTHDGEWNLGFKHHLDLFEIPTPRTVWINIYEWNSLYVSIYGTRAAADNQASSDRVACLEITYRPGDGLEKGGE